MNDKLSDLSAYYKKLHEVCLHYHVPTFIVEFVHEKTDELMQVYGAGIKKERQRTSAQNRSLHKFLENLSQELNDAGLDLQKTLKPGIAIPWSAATCKELIWRPIMTAMTMKKSTTELTTSECTRVYDVLNRHLGEMFGLSVEWPSLESEALEKETK